LSHDSIFIPETSKSTGSNLLLGAQAQPVNTHHKLSNEINILQIAKRTEAVKDDPSNRSDVTINVQVQIHVANTFLLVAK